MTAWGRGLGLAAAALGAVLSAWTPPALAADAGRPLSSALVDVWNNRDGLPQLTVQAIVQDRPGYLWLGTQAGLVRFDGLHFQQYGLQQAPALGSADVLALLPLPDGALVIGTAQGLAVMQGGKFAAVTVSPQPGLARMPVRALAQCPGTDEFWAASPEGLYRGTIRGV